MVGAHCYIIFWTCRSFSHFTFYIPLEVLYYEWSQLKAVTKILKYSTGDFGCGYVIILPIFYVNKQIQSFFKEKYFIKQISHRLLLKIKYIHPIFPFINPQQLQNYSWKNLHLRILTGKKDPQITLQRLRKVWIWTFGSLVHQINSF